VRAAVYARVSTERQQTIDSQLAALRAWAEASGHELNDRHVFRDEGYSGSRLDRLGLDAVRDGEVEILGVLAPDRLARKYAYQALLLEEFRRAGCAVGFLNRAISDDPGDQLLLQIQGAVAEYERALLSERFRRGKLQKARAGQFVGVHAPYGYRHLPRRDGVAGRLAIDEAEVVRMLYGWLSEERLTLRQILKRLNAGPWLPRSGRRPWAASTVHHILSDPVYTGTAYANRYEYVAARKPRGGRRPGYGGKGCRRLRPEEQWIPIAVPPLIDRATAERAAAQLARNATLASRNSKRHDYLLRCLLTCGGCGLAMVGTTRPTPGGERRYYRCGGKDWVRTGRAQPCPRACVDGEALERAVWGHIRDLLADPERLTAQFRHFAAEIDRNSSREQGPERRLMARLDGLARRRPAARCLPGRGNQPGGADGTAAAARRAAARLTSAARQGTGGTDRSERLLRTGARSTGRGLVGREAGGVAARHRAHHRSREQPGDPLCHPAAQPTARARGSCAAKWSIAFGSCARCSRSR
jgi:site-specific DNA recombinase